MNTCELVLAGVDVQDMMARLVNNEKLARMIVGKFLQDPTYEKLCQAVAQEDWTQAEFHCHTLKGVCGNLSLKELFQLLQKQLCLFRTGQPRQAAEMMPQITGKLDIAKAHMALWIMEQ